MGRSERREYFERLCILRDRYGSDPDERRGVLSVEDAILYAEAVMIALDEPDWDDALPEHVGEAPLAEPSDSALAGADGTPTSDASDASVGIIEFDGATRRMRRIWRPEWPLGQRPVGRWTSDTDGWRHLGRFFDPFGPAAGGRPD
jgi:hypothetical protein